ncbi:MAG: hypothetical protein ACTSV2_09820 [Candidatus Thorarchaeota archaeon]
MSESSTNEKSPYLVSGEIERRVRLINILIGLSLLVIQFLFFPIENWLLTPGFVLPMFIIMIGMFYVLTTSMESAHLIFDNVIRPRLGAITENQERDYFSFKKAVKVSVLMGGYLGAVVLTWIWVTLNNLGADPLWGMVFLFFSFTLFLFATGSIAGNILKYTKYKNIIPLLEVEVAWIMSLRVKNNR